MPHDLNRADEQILDALEAGARNPSWLADELDYTRQYVHQRLQLLVAADMVRNLGHGLYEHTGGGGRPSETVDDGRAREEPVSVAESNVVKDDRSDERDQLRELVPGRGDDVDTRVDAVLAMRDELRDRGSATYDQLLDVVDIAATGYADGESFWKNCGREGLRSLANVSPPPRDSSEWRWMGE